MSGFDELTTVEAISYSYAIRKHLYHSLHYREIRLVRLHQGAWLDKIECRLLHAPLDNKPVYKALSYVWGSPRATRTVLVNGHPYQVTVNLESALRRLRLPDADIIIWIDALCINQSNNAERTDQVNLMHDIYSSAEEVVVHLGEVHDKPVHPSKTIFYGDDRDLEKLQLFQSSMMSKKKSKLDHAVQIFSFLRVLAGEPDLEHFPAFNDKRKLLDTKQHREIFEGVRRMLLARWWNRIWVIQEVVVPKTITAIYGSASAPWSMLVDAALWESKNRSSSLPFVFPHEYSSVLAYYTRTILDIEHMRQRWREGELTKLLPLLRMFSGRKASDDLDKVYALLSLARGGTSIVPEYSLNVVTVYIRVVLDIIKHSRSLDALAGDLGRKDRQDLPSWVPDWSASFDDFDRRRADKTEQYNASNGCVVFVQDHSDKLWAGLQTYLEYLDGNMKFMTKGSGNHVARFTTALGSKEWMEWLPDSSTKTWDECLQAISNCYTDQGTVVCLKDYCDGHIQLPGFQLDTVLVIGETAFSEETLLDTVHSWATLVREWYFEVSKAGGDLGEKFRRTICADRIGKQKVGGRDQEIAGWFYRKEDKNWELLFKGCAERVPSPEIILAIQSACVRRTFFITKNGHMGLGPSRMRVGDHVYHLLGAHTPFVLRNAGARLSLLLPEYPSLGDVARDCLEVVGDTYLHGMMDGEAMSLWRERPRSKAQAQTVEELARRWMEIFRVWGWNGTKKSARSEKELDEYDRIQNLQNRGTFVINEDLVSGIQTIDDTNAWSLRPHPTRDTNPLSEPAKPAVTAISPLDEPDKKAQKALNLIWQQIRNLEELGWEKRVMLV